MLSYFILKWGILKWWLRNAMHVRNTGKFQSVYLNCSYKIALKRNVLNNGFDFVNYFKFHLTQVTIVFVLLVKHNEKKYFSLYINGPER